MDLEAKDEIRWASWDWKEGGRDSSDSIEWRPMPPDASPNPSHPGQPWPSSRTQTQTQPRADAELPLLTMDELDAFVNHGAVPSTVTTNPTSSHEQQQPQQQPTQRPSRPPAVLARSASPARPDTAPAEPQSQKRPALQPSMRQSPAPQGRTSMFRRSFRAAGKAAGSAMAILMAHQPDIEPPEKRPSDSSSANDMTSAKRQRYE